MNSVWLPTTALRWWAWPWKTELPSSLPVITPMALTGLMINRASSSPAPSIWKSCQSGWTSSTSKNCLTSIFPRNGRRSTLSIPIRRAPAMTTTMRTASLRARRRYCHSTCLPYTRSMATRFSAVPHSAATWLSILPRLPSRARTWVETQILTCWPSAVQAPITSVIRWA